MEENSNIILTMEYEDGTVEKKELLSIFRAENGCDYAALIAVNEDEKEREQEDTNIELVRVKPFQNENMEEDYLIECIESEDELLVAKEAFEKSLQQPDKTDLEYLLSGLQAVREVIITPLLQEIDKMDPDKLEYLLNELQATKEAIEQLQQEINKDKENVEELVLSFKNGGKFEDWKIVDVFDHNGRKYIALIPESELNNENINIHLMRLNLTVQDGIEGCEVYSITSDMEYEEVERVFANRINATNKEE